jgi:hypothetical protein
MVRARSVSACIYMLMVSSAFAVGVSALDLDALTHDSDLIVVGKVISVREVDTTRVTVFSQDYRARVLVGLIHVDQILKGAAPSATVSFKFYLPETFVGWQSVTPNAYAAFFFKSGLSGEMEFTNPYYPSVPAHSDSRTSGATAIDRVLETAQAVVYAPNETLNQKMTALQIISYSKSPTSTGSLKSALSHPEEYIRLEAATALVERNDSSGLNLLVDAILQEPSTIPDGMRQSLAANIGTWLTDPKAAPELVNLLKSPSAEIRRAAAEGLWRTHSQQAVMPLLTMLGDSDTKVRYFSVVGLAEITGQLEWRPNPDDFAASSTKYLNHWIEWGAAYTPQNQEPASVK